MNFFINQFDNKTPCVSIIFFVTNIILDLNNLTTSLYAIVLHITSVCVFCIVGEGSNLMLV